MRADTRAMVFFEANTIVCAILVYYKVVHMAVFLGLHSLFWLALAVKREP